METENSKVFEINGVKMEVDLRTAKVSRIDTFKVGDPVKLLYKLFDTSSGDIKFGIIVGFDQFKAMPTITVAYLDYSEIKYAYINSSTKHEMLAVQSHDLTMEKTWVIDRMKERIIKAKQEVIDQENKLNTFIQHFGIYFKDGLPKAAE